MWRLPAVVDASRPAASSADHQERLVHRGHAQDHHLQRLTVDPGGSENLNALSFNLADTIQGHVCRAPNHPDGRQGHLLLPDQGGGLTNVS